MKKNQKNNGNADNLQAGKQRTMRKPLSASIEASLALKSRNYN